MPPASRIVQRRKDGTFVDQRTSSEDTRGAIMHTPWVRKGLLVLASVLVVGMAVGVGLRYAAAAPAPWVSLPQSVAPQVANATITGSVAPSQRMTIGVTLQSRNEANLKAYAMDVAKPKSKVFHQYLTPAQFALNFGADPAALNATERYFQSQGLHLDSVTSGGLFLQYTGNVAQVEAALHTHINSYRAPDGRTFFANATAIQIPSALAPSILDVAGTENARVSHPAGAIAPANHGANVAKNTVRRPSVTHPNVTVTCPITPSFSGAAAPYTATGLLPTQFNNAYNFQNSTNPGNGMWAAFVEMDGYSLGDLAQYANCVGESSAIQTAINGSSSSSTPFIITQNVSSGGGNAVTSAPGANYGTPLTPGANAVSVEEELEIVLGLVPNITHISVIQTANTTLGIQTALSTIATENAAQVVGYQWGMCEADAGFSNASAEEQLIMQMTLQGQSTFAATGNNGLYACAGDGNNFRQFGFTVQDPASDPFVTAVGGTELGLTTNVASTAHMAAEQAWNNYPQNGSLAAGGAGISMFWAAPTWQQNAKAAITAANTTGKAYTGVDSLYNPNATSTTNIPARIVPDVSAAADPVNSSAAIYCSVGSNCTSGTTSFTNVGGTTEAEAIWAASAIEANQTSGAPSTGAGGRLSDIAPALYTLYGQDTTNNTPTITLNAVAYCDYANQLGSTAISTTASTGDNIGGLVTVVPASMNGIISGMKVTLPGIGNNNLAVSAVTATSFQVTLTTPTAATAALSASYSDTITTTPFGPGTASVAVTATANLIVGQYLLIDSGLSSSEIVTVSAISDATHFTATFLKAHSGGATAVAGTLVNATSVASGLTATATTSTYELGAVGQTAMTPASMTGIVTGASLSIGGTETVTATVPSGANYFVATFTGVHAVTSSITGGGHALAGTAVSFALGCSTAANFVLNNSVPLASSVTTLTSSFPQNATYNYQQLPGTATLMYGSQAGFSVVGNYAGAGNAYLSGFNALTGLGSPNVGPTSSTAGQLLGYLNQQSRLGQSRVYMVAQGLSDNKYWIASYGTNPYVSNMPTNTAWYPLNTVAFSGPPVLLDDNNANPQNLIVLGPAMPTATGLAMYNWNIATATATQISLAGGNLPGAYAGSTTSCTSISGATDGTGGLTAAHAGVYCVTSTGALYSTSIALGYTGSKITSATASNWTNSPLLNTVSYAPQIASDNNGNYLVLETNTGGAGVYYQYFANVGGVGIPFNSTAGGLPASIVALFPYASGATSGLSPFSFGTPLLTTCLTTPSAAYVAVSKAFAVACTASDTKQMWDNVYFPGNGKFNGQWSLLGQPSTSVTFMPGNAVSVDNYATDQAYGQIFYIAEGSDKAMYLDSVNASASRYLGKSSGWMSISLAGIFNTNSAADYVNS
jgi:subtilase family serine protease